MSAVTQTNEVSATYAAGLSIPSNILIEGKDDENHFRQVVKNAVKVGVLDKLQDILNSLGSYASGQGILTRVRLFRDFAPMSFRFARDIASSTPYGVKPAWDFWFQGGIIYSGPTPDDSGYVASGLAPALSVSVDNPGIGWSIHT